MIAWIDLETTGLDERAAASGILEIALVITDDDLKEIASINLVMRPVAHCLNWVEQLHPRVFEMHTKNGLIDDVLNNGIRRYEAKDKLLDFLKLHLTDQIGKVPLGGSTIGFDRVWLREFLPEVHDCFHYRSIDVTSVNLLADRWAKKLREGIPRQAEGAHHRAMADIQHSIATLRYYKENGLFKKIADTYPLVIVESPYAPAVKKPTGVCACENIHVTCVYCEQLDVFDIQLHENVRYAREAMKDCLMRGEAPYASHLLYTQHGVLDDTIPTERNHGIQAGFAWRQVAQKTVVYTDRGISRGMEFGIADAEKRGCPIEYRTLSKWSK